MMRYAPEGCSVRHNGAMAGRWLPALARMSDQRHLSAVRNGFARLMPLMLAGAFAVLINQFPLPAYQRLMLGLFGDNFQIFGRIVYKATYNVVSMAAVLSVCGQLCGWYNEHRRMNIHQPSAMLTALACYMCVCYTADDFLSLDALGTKGLLPAIVVALVVAECCALMFRLTKRGRQVTIFTQQRGGLEMSDTLHNLWPSVAIIALFGLVRCALNAMHLGPLHETIYRALSTQFAGQANTLGTALKFNLASQLLWTMGIHGNNVLDEIVKMLYNPAMQANVSDVAAGLAPTHLFTKTFFDTFVYMGGCGSTLCYLLAVAITPKADKHLARLAAPPSLFNINEPLMYGIPIVWNPIYLLPFVLAPTAMVLLSAGALSAGLVPYTRMEVTWVAPVFFSGVTATGSAAGALLQAVNLAVGTAIYLPFVRFDGRERARRFQACFADMLRAMEDRDQTPASVLSRQDSTGEMARALANDLLSARAEEFFLLYQPQVDASTGRMRAAEALLRWQHPVHGLVPPLGFIPLAEHNGSMARIGALVVQSACRARAQWAAAGMDDAVYVSVNVSAVQFRDPGFSSLVLLTLQQNRLSPRQLELEVTESVAMTADVATMSNLTGLHEAGVRIAIDDFGMGYSSLVYINRFPVDTLKVDKALSRGAMTNAQSVDIVRAILSMCESLNIHAVVEYAETAEQIALLRSIGCDTFQGYYYSKPVAVDAIPLFARARLPGGDATR